MTAPSKLMKSNNSNNNNNNNNNSNNRGNPRPRISPTPPPDIRELLEGLRRWRALQRAVRNANKAVRAARSGESVGATAELLRQHTPNVGVTSDADDSEEELSPINLRINSAVHVSQNNNIVCIAASPADHANAIARAVLTAIQENSSGQCGIPMIDENGRPRPITIAVDAGLVVRGGDNLVGTEAVIQDVLRQRARKQQRAGDVGGDKEMAEAEAETRPSEH